MNDEPKQPQNGESAGGKGGRTPGITEQADILLEQRALRQRWDISPQEMRDVISRQVEIATSPKSSHRQATAAARAIICAVAQNQTDDHKQQPDELNINLAGVTILEDDDWYENRDRLNAIAAAASGSDSNGPGPLQGGGRGASVGKNGNGSAGRGTE